MCTLKSEKARVQITGSQLGCTLELYLVLSLVVLFLKLGKFFKNADV